MRKRTLPLVAAGLGLAAAGAAFAATRRTATRHRTGVDPRADDASVFDLEAIGVTHHRIPSHDGGELHLVEKGDADARPLVLLHGITLQARIWGYQFRDMSDRYRVVAADLRGHGLSRAGADGYGLPLLARDLRTVLEQLDLRDAIVVGHSMGGMTLMQFCADHIETLDERVAGCVFLATAPVAPFPAAALKALRRVQPRMLALGERRGWDRMPGHNTAPPDIVYVMARRVFGRDASPLHVELTRQCVADMTNAAVLPSAINLLSHDADEALARTNTPSLVIGGELDRLLPPSLSRRIAASLPNSELHILDGAGHQLMLERPDEVAELIDRFAKEL
jgi:pimeloyl-ACP methyl ester carboxylesterase